MQRVSRSKAFSGYTDVYEHTSTVTKTQMRFSVYLPPDAEKKSVPVLYWLSGLTCNENNFMHKAGAQRLASELGLMIVAPDTSPRGEGVADRDTYDLGIGAGFYVDATEEPWAKNYQMYSYITKELPDLICKELPAIPDRQSISGHSMGGHGALTIALKNPGRFRSVSAFAPICAPSECPWGQQALSAYLGSDPSAWKKYDATELAKQVKFDTPVLIDQGSDDEFLPSQLFPENLLNAAKENGWDNKIQYRLQQGYDHSYNFISTFIEEHLRFHREYL